MKRLLALALVALACLPLSGCGGNVQAEATELRFSDAVQYEQIAALDGQRVTITGYIATLSPLDGSYIYLLNLPYQSCPFCLPNSTELTNTMAVYAATGTKFTFTQQPVRVTGTMEVGDFSDDFGYQYNYRIVDAACETVDLSEVSAEYALWQSVAADGVVEEVNNMLNYLYFVCQWTEYQSVQTYADGSTDAWYLYPGDALNVLGDAESGYGYAEESSADYFPGLISRVRAVSDTGLEDLIAIIEDAQALEVHALKQLQSGAFAYDEAQDKYTLDDAENMTARYDDIYLRFSQWLGRWEI